METGQEREYVKIQRCKMCIFHIIYYFPCWCICVVCVVLLRYCDDLYSPHILCLILSNSVASFFLNCGQGWLPGLKSDGDASQLPTIAIVASYDTFGAAPVCYLFNALTMSTIFC